MKKLLGIIAILIACVHFPKTVWANEVAQGSAVLKKSLPLADERGKKLTGFLKSRNSPLALYSSCFIEAADKYQINWRLVPAITGVESSFGKHLPPNSYNAYGWNNGQYLFESWEQSIDYVSGYLKEKYISRGLETPTQIGPVYAPPSRTWANKVSFLMSQIESFELNSASDNLILTL